MLGPQHHASSISLVPPSPSPDPSQYVGASDAAAAAGGGAGGGGGGATAGGGYAEYARSEVLQMVGRAGRPQFDTEVRVGACVLLLVVVCVCVCLGVCLGVCLEGRERRCLRRRRAERSAGWVSSLLSSPYSLTTPPRKLNQTSNPQTIDAAGRRRHHDAARDGGALRRARGRPGGGRELPARLGRGAPQRWGGLGGGRDIALSTVSMHCRPPNHELST